MKCDNQDFRHLLQQEFISRCRKNPSYSLRAYARALKIQPSPLSAILRGKRPITRKMKHRLGFSLGLKPEEFAYEASSVQKIELDTFAIISDWYHFAILELTRVKSFRPDPNYIAKVLGVSRTQVEIAMGRLERVGLLKIEGKRWIDMTNNGFATNIHDDLTTEAARRLQKQILEKSIQALEDIPIAERDHTSMTMAIHSGDLKKAKNKIRRFRRELCKQLERNPNPTHVYHLNISLYPVSKSEAP
jgi:hypothetical protein